MNPTLISIIEKTTDREELTRLLRITEMKHETLVRDYQGGLLTLNKFTFELNKLEYCLEEIKRRLTA